MSIRGAVLDVDGTVLRGDDPVPGARAGLRTLADRGIERLFVSNNPTKAPSAYAARFRRAGFEVDPSEVLTAGTVTVEYLRTHHAEDRLYLIGESGLREQCRAAGLTVTDEETAAEVGVVSIDREFDYDDLTAALSLLGDGSVSFVGTDPDMVIPAADRNVPGSGAIINAVAGVTGREPDVVLGKPSEACLRMVRQRLAYPSEAVLVVGDRLDTDIALGNRAGMPTALVGTGVTDERTLTDTSEDERPDYVLDSLAEVDRVLDAESGG